MNRTADSYLHLRPGADIYGPESSERGERERESEREGETVVWVIWVIWVRILVLFSHLFTPVSRLLTHITYITHTHPKIKSDAVLKLKAR
jgi:hypothetical protein